MGAGDGDGARLAGGLLRSAGEGLGGGVQGAEGVVPADAVDGGGGRCGETGHIIGVGRAVRRGGDAGRGIPATDTAVAAPGPESCAVRNDGQRGDVFLMALDDSLDLRSTLSEIG